MSEHAKVPAERFSTLKVVCHNHPKGGIVVNMEGERMKRLVALAFAVPLALGLGFLANDANAAPASSGALNVLMSSEAVGGGETVKDGLVQPAYYYYRRRYYRPYRYGYYRPYYRRYYRPYRYGYYGY